MKKDKTIKLYVYVDGVNDVPFYGSDAGEYEAFILANGEQYITSEGFVFNVRNVNEQIELGDFRYDAKRMGGAPTITCTLMYEDCLDDFWSENVYAEFNGEKYFLKQTPTSSYNNESTMYKHDLELVSERVILDNVYFFDAVIGDPKGDDKPVSNSTKVVFFGNIHEFVKRLNSSLEYAKLLKWKDGVDENGNEIKIPNGYHVVVDDDNNITKEERLMSFEDQFFSNVLQEIYNTYEVPYYFEGKTIHIGYSNKNAVVPTFSYGVDNALLSITKNNANYKVVNRATAIGSSDNIPFYYPNNSPKGEIAAEHSRKGASVSIIDAERYANKIALDGVIKYEDFSIAEESMTSEYGAYESGEAIFLNKITGSTTRDFDLTFFASNAGKLTLNLDYAIDNVRNPIKGSSLSSDTISCRFTVTLYKVRGDSVVVAKSVQRGSVEVPITSMGSYVAKITMEFASKRADNTLTCNYKLYYSFDEGFTGWTYEGKEINLSDIGLSVGDAVAGDTITQKLVKYVNTSQNLMPSIYRETDGEERFYNATNDTYEGVEFNNPYVEGKPKEHIFTVEDIKPTIKETEVNGLRIDMFSEFAYDDDDNDETYEDEEGNVYFKHPYFYGKLRVMDFNLFDHAIEQQPMTISFTSGHCGACNFEIGVTEEYPQKNPVQVYEKDTTINGILHKAGSLKRDENGMVLAGIEGTQQDVTTFQERQQDTSKYEVWIALKKEEETYGILMPQVAHRPKACTEGQNDGDTFVIIGINLPQSYITNAEKKLESEIIKYLQDNNAEKFTFSINFSRIYFEENKILEQLSENSKIAIMYNGQRYDLYVSSFSYSMSEGDVLPEIRVELDETLKVSQNALQNAISQVKSELGRAIGSIDVVGAATPYFIRKDADDEAQGRINFKKGIKFGEGGKVEIMPDNGAKLTIDYLEVSKKATFNSLEIAEKKHVGGQILLTPAAMTCGEVEEFDDYYRCYFQTKNSEGNDEIFNQFAENDLAICQTYNAWGSRYYWRKVVGVGEDYIDLSKTLCDEYSDIPMAGDKIVQLGNTEDITRQAAIVLSAYGDDSPSLIMYNGINSYSLAEKNITGIIWNPKTLEPQMYSYGSFFFGDRRLKNNFITFQKKEGDTDKNLYINGKVTIGAGSEGLSNLSEWGEKQAQIDTAQQAANDAQERASVLESTTNNLSTQITDIKNNITETVEEINKRLDGVVENYFEEGVPTTTNYPANQWDDNEKRNHIGDTYTNIQAYIDDETTPDAGKSWRWVYTDSEHSGYHWHPIADSDAVKALQDAAKAQSTADGKSTTFLRQPTNYQKGDLWILQSDTDHEGDKKGEILTANTASLAYNANHWSKEIIYTDDTAVNELDLTGVNLIDSSAGMTITAPTDNRYNYGRRPITIKVNEGENYTICVESITVTNDPNGKNPIYFTALLRDRSNLTNSIVESESINYITKEKKYITYKIKKGIKDQNADLLLYAGTSGDTAGVTVEYKKMSVIRGNKPMAVWEKSPNDALSDAKNYTDSVDSSSKDLMAQNIGYADYADMVAKVSENGKIVMEGGYLNAELIEANAITSEKINVDNLIVNQVYAAGGKTTIDENGNLTSISGNIGGFTIGEDFLSSEGENYSAELSAAMISIGCTDNKIGTFDSITSSATLQSYPSLSGFDYALGRFISTFKPSESTPVSDRYANKALYISATGALDAQYPISSAYPRGGNFAIWCAGGMYAGMRPMTRTTTSPTALTKYDHTLLVNTNTPNSNYDIQLPDWELGQEYEIIMLIDKITLTSSSANIHLPEANAWSQSAVTLSGWGGIIKIYAMRDASSQPFWFVFKIK